MVIIMIAKDRVALNYLSRHDGSEPTLNSNLSIGWALVQKTEEFEQKYKFEKWI